MYKKLITTEEKDQLFNIKLLRINFIKTYAEFVNSINIEKNIFGGNLYNGEKPTIAINEISKTDLEKGIVLINALKPLKDKPNLTQRMKEEGIVYTSACYISGNTITINELTTLCTALKNFCTLFHYNERLALLEKTKQTNPFLNKDIISALEKILAHNQKSIYEIILDTTIALEKEIF